MDASSPVLLGTQLGLTFWHSRAIIQRPRKPERLPLKVEALKAGIRITFRLGPAEAAQMKAVMQREESSASELIREALYDQWGIGELEELTH